MKKEFFEPKYLWVSNNVTCIPHAFVTGGQMSLCGSTHWLGCDERLFVYENARCKRCLKSIQVRER
jgi:hypothetical protein